jgi:hypothetical protein
MRSFVDCQTSEAVHDGHAPTLSPFSEIPSGSPPSGRSARAHSPHRRAARPLGHRFRDHRGARRCETEVADIEPLRLSREDQRRFIDALLAPAKF